MFPAAILASLADLLVAEFSRCARRRAGPGPLPGPAGAAVSWLFGICAGGMIFAAARPLGELLYHSEAAGACLRLYAPLVPFSTWTSWWTPCARAWASRAPTPATTS